MFNPTWKTLRYLSFGHTIEIFIPEQYESIAFCMSGGMDSALLAALVMPHLDLSRVTVYTIDKGTAVEYVAGILQKLNVAVTHKHLKLVERPNGEIAPDLESLTYSHNCVYTGSTANPDWADLIPEGQKPKRNVDVSWRNMMFPFGKTQKNVTLDIMKQTDNLHLLPYTHTCTERPYTNCGVCFACRERKWAFEQNQMLDVLKY
jgi:7-cyano-7-deazaguanine synthase in queuosine biosynthesis